MSLKANIRQTRLAAVADAPDDVAMNSIRLVQDLVSEGISVGERVAAGALTLFPLNHHLPAGDHLLFQEAHQRGLVTIDEASEAGAVGELKVTNRGTQPVLLLEGEVLLGMKQTRVLNATILVPGLAVLVVPVSCVEVGRWHRVSGARSGRDRLNLSPRVRGAKSASVLRSARATGRYVADQRAVWDGVAGVLAEHRVSAPTGSYSDIASSKAADILDRMRDLRPTSDQAGVLVYAGGRPTCLDVFDSASTLGAVWEALIGSYAADVEFDGLGGRGGAGRRPTRTLAARWLSGLAQGDLATTRPVGLGETVTCIAPSIEAAALVHDGRLLHLAAFPGRHGRARTAFAPPARRRS